MSTPSRAWISVELADELIEIARRKDIAPDELDAASAGIFEDGQDSGEVGLARYILSKAYIPYEVEEE